MRNEPWVWPEVGMSGRAVGVAGSGEVAGSGYVGTSGGCGRKWGCRDEWWVWPEVGMSGRAVGVAGSGDAGTSGEGAVPLLSIPFIFVFYLILVIRWNGRRYQMS